MERNVSEKEQTDQAINFIFLLEKFSEISDVHNYSASGPAKPLKPRWEHVGTKVCLLVKEVELDGLLVSLPRAP